MVSCKLTCDMVNIIQIKCALVIGCWSKFLFKFTSMNAEYLDGDELLRFELKENGITAFETSDEQQYLSVEKVALV